MIDILLVDDEPRMLELLTLYLTPIGYNCICARSGEEAISHIENQNFKFILLDIMMPTMDGWETCKKSVHLVTFLLLWLPLVIKPSMSSKD